MACVPQYATPFRIRPLYSRIRARDDPRPWAHRRGTTQRASRPSAARSTTFEPGERGIERRCASLPDAARAEDRRFHPPPIWRIWRASNLVSEPTHGPDVRKQRETGKGVEGTTIRSLSTSIGRPFATRDPPSRRIRGRIRAGRPRGGKSAVLQLSGGFASRAARFAPTRSAVGGRDGAGRAGAAPPPPGRTCSF